MHDFEVGGVFMGRFKRALKTVLSVITTGSRSTTMATRFVSRGRCCAALPFYLVPERKLGFFVQNKEDENFNRRNTLSISRIKI